MSLDARAIATPGSGVKTHVRDRLVPGALSPDQPSSSDKGRGRRPRPSRRCPTLNPVTDGDGLTSSTLGEGLRSEVPPDDAGAETFDRYEWQAMMATVDLLALYYDALTTDSIQARSLTVDSCASTTRTGLGSGRTKPSWSQVSTRSLGLGHTPRPQVCSTRADCSTSSTDGSRLTAASPADW